MKRKHRFASVSAEKAEGATYTPKKLADFVATQMVASASITPRQDATRVLDPAVGEGELLTSLIARLREHSFGKIHVFGYDTDGGSLAKAERRIQQLFADVEVSFTRGDFLDVVVDDFRIGGQRGLFESAQAKPYDYIIANPPYIRTQVLGAERAQEIAERFGLNGRVDLYHAFILGIGSVLKAGGTAGLIVSNRFMTTRSGESVRRSLLKNFALRHVWDFGDTKLFDAAVLPAVLLLEGGMPTNGCVPRFS